MLRLSTVNCQAGLALASTSAVLTGSTLAAEAAADNKDAAATFSASPPSSSATPSAWPVDESLASLPQVFCHLTADLANCPESFKLITAGRNGTQSLQEVLSFVLGPEIEYANGAFKADLPDFSAVSSGLLPTTMSDAYRRLRTKLTGIGLKVTDDYCRAAHWYADVKGFILKALDAEVAWAKAAMETNPLAQNAAVLPLLLMNLTCNYAVARAAMVELLGHSYFSEVDELGFAQQEVLAARMHFFLCQAYVWLLEALNAADSLPNNSALPESMAADIAAAAELVEQIRRAFRHLQPALKAHEQDFWLEDRRCKAPHSRASENSLWVDDARFKKIGATLSAARLRKLEFMSKKKKRLEEIARPCGSLSLEAASDIARVATAANNGNEDSLRRILAIVKDPFFRCKEGIRSVRDWESRYTFAQSVDVVRRQPLKPLVAGVEFSGVPQREAVESLLSARLELLTAKAVARSKHVDGN